jgi:hypothetical protein
VYEGSFSPKEYLFKNMDYLQGNRAKQNITEQNECQQMGTHDWESVFVL